MGLDLRNPIAAGRSGLTSTVSGVNRISHQISTAEADPGMSTALHSLGLLDVLSSTPAGPPVAPAEMRQMRLVSIPVWPPRYETW